MSGKGIEVNMTPPHPGEFVRVEVIEDMGLTTEKAAGILGIPEQPLSELLNGEAELTPDMARRIEKAFGVGGDMLLRMQAWRHGSGVVGNKVSAYPSPSMVSQAQPNTLSAGGTDDGGTAVGPSGRVDRQAE